MDSLPPEIISKILGYLNGVDLMNARLVNRKMYQQTCVHPLNDRFKIVFKYLRSRPQLYGLHPRHVRIEDLTSRAVKNYLTEFDNLETLKFHSANISIQDITSIPHFGQRLRSIEFTSCNLELNKYTAEVVLPCLTRLKLKNCYAVNVDTYNYFIKLASNLKEFVFRSGNTNPSIMDNIGDMLRQHSQTIEMLDIEYKNPYIIDIFKIDFEHLKTLRLMSDFRDKTLHRIWKRVGRYHLETLYITLHPTILPFFVAINKQFMDEFQHINELKHLHLKNCLIDDEALNVITSVPNLKLLVIKQSVLKCYMIHNLRHNFNMKILKLQISVFYHVEINCLPQVTLCWPNVTYLDLSSSNITNMDLEYICTNWPQLVALKLDGCFNLKERDHKGQWITILLQNLINLKYISMGDTRFSERICDFMRLPKLRVLHLFTNIGIEGLRILGENNPSVEIVCPDRYHLIESSGGNLNIQDYFPNCTQFICQCRKYFQAYQYSL